MSGAERRNWMFDRVKWVRGLALAAQEKLVLFMLVAYSDAEGWCWPGVERLARETQHSERIVQYALRILEGIGCVQVLREPGKTLRYFLNESTTVVPVLTGRSARERYQGLGGALSAPLGGALSDAGGCTERRGGVHSGTKRGALSAPEGDQEVLPLLKETSEGYARAREGVRERPSAAMLEQVRSHARR